MGGNNANKQMKKVCETKEITVSDTGVVNWSSKQRESKINDVLERLGKL